MASRDASQKALNNIIKVIIIKKDNNDKNYRQNKPNRYYITTQYIFWRTHERVKRHIFSSRSYSKFANRSSLFKCSII